MLATSPLPADTVWQNWLHNPAVRRFESGLCDTREFAETMIGDLSLAISTAEFLEHFNAWPRGLYPGALELLDSLSARFQLACLSNTNQAHFDSCTDMRGLLTRFDAQFLSHQTGLLKPDRAAFENALRALAINRAEVLFFDDNPHNVEAAGRIGINAVQVNTPAGVLDALNRISPGSQADSIC